MIIVEGPDGSGKSILVKKLKSLFEIDKVVHWNTPPKSQTELEANLRWSKDLVKIPVIQDRTPWVTEPIYSIVKMAEPSYEKWLFYLMGTILLRSTLIYCRPPNEVIKKYATTPSSPVDTPEYLLWIEENIGNIIALYDFFMTQANPIIIYDWTRPEKDKKFEELKKRIERLKLFYAIRANSLTFSRSKGSIEGEPLLQAVPKGELDG